MAFLATPIAAELLKWGLVLILALGAVYWVYRNGKKDVIADINEERLKSIKARTELEAEIYKTPIEDLKTSLKKRNKA